MVWPHRPRLGRSPIALVLLRALAATATIAHAKQTVDVAFADSGVDPRRTSIFIHRSHCNHSAADLGQSSFREIESSAGDARLFFNANSDKHVDSKIRCSTIDQNNTSNNSSIDIDNGISGSSASLALGIWDIPRVTYRLGYIGLMLLPSIVLSPLLLFESSQDYWWSWFKKSAVDIGPCMIKLCQWVSTRPDLFPDYIIRPLSDFQYKTSVDDFEYIARVLRESFGDQWEQSFNLSRHGDGSLVVLGSGCVAAVIKGEMASRRTSTFRGRNANGIDSSNINININSGNASSSGQLGSSVPVAIKILRSGVKESISIDLSILNFFAYYTDRYVGYYFPNLPSFAEVVEQFSTLMNDQINFSCEASNLKTFNENFKGHESMSVEFPEPLLVANKVLVESFSEGSLMAFHLDDDVQSKKLLAKLGLHAVLKMVFEDNFVHADLHPGNIVVRSTKELSALAPSYKLSLIDAGLCVKLSSKDRINLVDLFLAVIENDGRRVGRLMIDRSNSHDKVVDIEGFMRAMDDIVSSVNKQGLLLNNIDIGLLLKTILVLCYKHNVKLDSNFASIMTAIVIIEGLGRRLDPTLNILQHAAPYIIKAKMFK